MFKHRMLSFLTAGLLLTAQIPLLPAAQVIAAEEVQEAAAPEIWDGSIDTSWFDAEENEAHISTAAQLAGFASLMTKRTTDFAGWTVYLEADIYLNDVSDFESWGSAPPANTWQNNAEFKGSFDGQGHTVYGAYQVSTEAHVMGFFGSVDGSVKNLNLEKVYFSSSGHLCELGGVCGNASKGSIDGCKVSGCLSATGYSDTGEASTYADRVGGICGVSHHANFSDCVSSAAITASDQAIAGGIVGDAAAYSNSRIRNCRNEGAIIGSTLERKYQNGIYYFPSGGIIGTAGNCQIERCCNTGDVTAKFSGGIAGCVISDQTCTISDCYNWGSCGSGIAKLTALQANNGSGTFRIRNCYSTGKATYGIAAKADAENCYYLHDEVSENGVGTAKSEENMKAAAFAEALGSAFRYNPDGYSLLTVYEADLDMTEITLTGLNQQKTLTLSTNYDGEPIWISDNTAVATVENGIVTAVSPGTTTVYALCGDARAVCTVTVDFGFSLNQSAIELKRGETVRLSILDDTTGKSAENINPVWISSDPSVASVDKTGLVTGEKPGETEIIVYFADIQLPCKVTVLPGSVNEEPAISTENAILDEGDVLTLTVKNYTGNITWVSSDAKCVTVKDGIVTAVAEGTATVYAILSTGQNLAAEISVRGVQASLYGDTDENGQVTLLDVILLNKNLLGLEQLSAVARKNADVNLDKTINNTDSLYILQSLVSLISIPIHPTQSGQ